MKTITAISISIIMLCMMSCESHSGRRDREQREGVKDSVYYSYSAGSVKCVTITLTGYEGDSVRYFNQMTFVKNSPKVEAWIKSESDGIMRYNESIDSLSVNKTYIDVIR